MPRGLCTGKNGSVPGSAPHQMSSGRPFSKSFGPSTLARIIRSLWPIEFLATTPPKFHSVVVEDSELIGLSRMTFDAIVGRRSSRLEQEYHVTLAIRQLCERNSGRVAPEYVRQEAISYKI